MYTEFDRQVQKLKDYLGTDGAHTHTFIPSTPVKAGPINMVSVSTPDKKKKEKTMYRDFDERQPMSLADAEQNKADYLHMRLTSIVDKKDTELRKRFNMDGPPRPKTWGEFREWIKDGQHIVLRDDLYQFKDEAELDQWSNYFGYLKFVDPSKPRDEKGYNEASKALYKASQEVEDDIAIRDGVYGLEALRAFEAKEF